MTGLRIKKKNKDFFFLLQDSVQCALEVSRLQLEEWKSQGPRAQEEALAQKALLQEELVTIRARMCDVSLVCNKHGGQGTRMTMALHEFIGCDMYINCRFCCWFTCFFYIHYVFFIFHKSSNLFIQEMERVWSQYERMESELSVIRSHLQHICNFGVPQVFELQ